MLRFWRPLGPGAQPNMRAHMPGSLFLLRPSREQIVPLSFMTHKGKERKDREADHTKGTEWGPACPFLGDGSATLMCCMHISVIDGGVNVKLRLSVSGCASLAERMSCISTASASRPSSLDMSIGFQYSFRLKGIFSACPGAPPGAWQTTDKLR